MNKKIIILPCLMTFLLVNQDKLNAISVGHNIHPVSAVPSTQKIVGGRTGFIPGQGSPVIIIPATQLTRHLSECRAVLLKGDGPTSKYVVADTNGDNIPDSLIVSTSVVGSSATTSSAPVSLDEATQKLQSLGGEGKLYLAIDSTGDGKADSCVAVTF